MSISKEIVEQLIAGTFTHDFIDITLTQQTTENPEIFTGSGYFYYKDKKPYLKFLHKKSDQQFRVKPTYSHLKTGEIISEEYLFSLKATDLSGKVWHADNINPYISMNVSPCGIGIDCELYEIRKTIENDYSEYQHYFFVPQRFNIPCNEFQNLGEGGQRRTRCSFILDNINISVLLEDNYSCIHLTSEQNVTLDQAKCIVDALSIAGGVLLTPTLSVTQTVVDKTLIFKEISNTKKLHLMEFLPQRIPHYLNEWIEFIKSYTEKFGTDRTFYYYWLKIFNAHQSDLENETLSLTVSIEGVINKFHSKFKQEDREFKKLCSDVKPIIDHLEINERVKSSIINLLQRSGQSSPKGILFNMARQGVFPKEMATAWFKARNRSAHAEHFKKHVWKDNVDNYILCLSLFYILLSYHIEYIGVFYHHHLPDAPLKKLNFSVNEFQKGDED
ncbi:hypothetical protein [Dickeya sp. Secpp 1600]|uniref:hypothetical protein n=1 Tax=Dickeya sp. Secpp 1600 TaxID=2037915 RepID=UPI000D314C07|nr:hypothetical protein [Dickeya sp. Secpp 1600]